MVDRVVVVGGGITGLTAAWTLQRAGVDVVVLEAGSRLGGKLYTGDLAGHEVELGADAFLARHGAATELSTRVGLGDDLVVPATGRVWLWIGGRLRPLPTGTVLGAPADPVALARSGVLSPAALIRAAAEPLVPRRRVSGDRSVADVIGERFGPAVVDTLVEPLLGGVHAGRPDQLSLDATAPMIAEAARAHRSLLVGLRAHRRGQVGSSANGAAPVFQTLASGLSRLPERLAADLGDAVRTSVPAVALEPTEGGWVVRVDGDGDDEAGDAVLLTAPAFVAADLLAEVAREAAAELAGIHHASVGVVTLAYPRSAMTDTPEGSGMLVPRTEGWLVKASTWVSRKWPHRDAGDQVLVRASVGRVDDHRWRDLDEDELVQRVAAELREAMGVRGDPAHASVTPWIDGLPQYTVGHRDRIDRVRRLLPAGIGVAGAACDGVGISPCVASAHNAARALL